MIVTPTEIIVSPTYIILAILNRTMSLKKKPANKSITLRSSIIYCWNQMRLLKRKIFEKLNNIKERVRKTAQMKGLKIFQIPQRKK